MARRLVGQIRTVGPAARYRPSTLTRIGAFVLGQVLRREPSGRSAESPRPEGRSGDTRPAKG